MIQRRLKYTASFYVLLLYDCLLSALEVCEVPGHRGDIPRVVYISVEWACGA